MQKPFAYCLLVLTLRLIPYVPRMKKLNYLLILLLGIASCTTLPKSSANPDKQILTVGPGPEDMVVDTITGQPRLLISCNARRKSDPYYGEINVYYPANGNVGVMKRTEPTNIHFCPHGIDLVKVNDTLILLVVNNDFRNHEQSILRYAVKAGELIFLNKITDPLIVSPNAVTGFQDGTLLISNDAGKMGDYTEALFKLKRCKIIYWNYNTCSVAAGKFCFANGITNQAGKVYLASTLQNKVWQFDFKDGKLINQQTVARVNGPDNIRITDGNLYVACHLRFLAFLGNMKKAGNYSPTTVYRIDLASGHKSVAFFDDGAKLSAGSTGLAFHNKLYVSGVFDAKMAVVNNPK